MVEAALALFLVVGLAASALIVAYVPWHLLFGVGLALVAGGLAIGIPAGFWYHVRLHRAVSRKAPLERRWWLSPMRLHDRLDEAERGGVLRWSYLGALGFVLALAGCALVAIGAWRSGAG